MPELTLVHWVYLLFLMLVIVAMIFRRDVVLPCIVGIFVIGLLYQGTVIKSAQVVFRALVNAGTDLFDIMLVIALMVSMLKAMQSIGADTLMVAPAKKVMKRPVISFFVLAIAMFIAATFFWPTPATALVGTILIPIAISTGLTPMAAAVAVNLAGHGMALSGDLVLQGAPAITSKAAGIDISLALTRGWLFAWVTGLVAIAVAFFMLRKEIFVNKEIAASIISEVNDSIIKEKSDKPANLAAKFFAAAVPTVFIVIVITMIISNLNPTFSKIKGGDATALLGGTAVFFMLAISMAGHKMASLEKTVQFLKEGFLFSIKIFAPVIPIAGFFFLGSPKIAPLILGKGAPGYLFDLGAALAASIPMGKIPLAFGMVIVGVLTGLDGSGFSGLPLTGALSNALGSPLGVDVATLAALAQVAAIFSGGGCLTAWAFGVVADAGIAGVNPIDLVRRNFIPVAAGLFASSVLAIILM